MDEACPIIFLKLFYIGTVHLFWWTISTAMIWFGWIYNKNSILISDRFEHCDVPEKHLDITGMRYNMLDIIFNNTTRVKTSNETVPVLYMTYGTGNISNLFKKDESLHSVGDHK